MTATHMIILVAGLIWASPAWAQACSFSFDPVSFGTHPSNAILPGAVSTLSTFRANCSGSPGSTIRLCIDLDGGTGGTESAGLYRLLQDDTGSGSFRVSLLENSSRATWGSAGAATYQPVLSDLFMPSSTGTASVTAYASVDSARVAPRAGLHSSQLRAAVRWGTTTASTCAQLPNVTLINVSMTLNLLSTCSVLADTLNFGAVFSLDAPVPGRSSIYVTCTSGSIYTVSLDKGLNSSSGSDRRMSFEQSLLKYELFSDPGFSRPWGDELSGSGVQGVGTGSQQTLVVYGRIPGGQSVPTGNYTDRVIVSVNF